MSTEQIKAVLETFTCGICNEIMNQPVCLLCQHTFCQECIIRSTNTYYENATSNDVFPLCPICKARYFVSEINQPNSVMTNVISTLLPLSYTEEEINERKREEQEEKEKLNQRAQAVKELYEEMRNTLPDAITVDHNDTVKYPPYLKWGFGIIVSCVLIEVGLKGLKAIGN